MSGWCFRGAKHYMVWSMNISQLRLLSHNFKVHYSDLNSWWTYSSIFMGQFSSHKMDFLNTSSFIALLKNQIFDSQFYYHWQIPVEIEIGGSESWHFVIDPIVFIADKNGSSYYWLENLLFKEHNNTFYPFRCINFFFVFCISMDWMIKRVFQSIEWKANFAFQK